MKFDIEKATPAILAGLAVIGVGATAVISAVCHANALPEIKKIREEEPEVRKVEVVKHTWKYYIPVLVSAGATITCVILSNRISAKQLAAMTAAASAAMSQTQRIKSEVKKVIGEEKWKEIEKVMSDDEVYEITGKPHKEGEVIFYDTFTNVCFYKEEATVKEAIYYTNRILAMEGKVSVGDFYELMDEPRPWFGDMYGWSVDIAPTEDETCAWVDIELDRLEKKDEPAKAYYKIMYLNEPYHAYENERLQGATQMSAFDRAHQEQGLPFK